MLALRSGRHGPPIILAASALGLLFSFTLAAQEPPPALVAQVAHVGRIHSMVFSRDGRLIATAGSDRTVKVWDVARRMLVRNLEGHAGEVRSVAFSSDGARLVTASHDHTVRVWEVVTGRTLSTLTGDARSWMVGADFGEDENTILATACIGEHQGDDKLNQLIRWNARTGKTIRRARNGCGPLYFSNDRLLAFGGTGDLWKAATLERLNSDEIAYQMGSAKQASFSPNGNLLVIVTSFGLDVWDVQRLVKVHAIRDLYLQGRDLMFLTAVAFSPDGRTIAAADEKGRVGLWDAATGQGIDVAERGPSREITALAFAPDGKTLVSASAGHPQAALAVWTVGAESVSLAGDFQAAVPPPAASTTDREPPLGTSDDRPRSALHPVSVVRFSPDGRLLASGGADRTIRLWNLQSGQLARTLRGHPGAIRSIAFSPHGTTLVSSSASGSLILWDSRSDEPRRVFEASAIMGMVEFGPDGHTITAGSSIAVWDTSRDEPVRRYGWACSFLAMSSDGKTLAGALDIHDRHSIMLIDAITGKELRRLRGHHDRITAGAFSPDGARLVSASADGTLKLWDARTGRLIATLSGHTGSVLAVAYDAKGTRIASGGADNAVKLWNARGRPVSTLTGHTHAVASVAFGPEGRTLASGSEDGTVRIWSPSQAALLVTLLPFADDEWLAHGPHAHFSGSVDKARYVAWRVGNTVYDFGQFFERFYAPDLLVRVFQGAAPLAADQPAGSAPPPDVMIVSPRPGQVFREPDVEVAIEVKNAGGGVDDVRLSLNGKQLDSTVATRDLRPSPPGSSLLKYRVSLLDGVNVLRATAFSSDRTESAPHEMTLRLEAPVKVAALRLLAVGISRYQNPGLSLNYPAADARELVGFFRAQGPRLFRELDITELSDEAATEATISQALVALQRRALPQDVVLLFLAGHGASSGPTWYFIPHDLRNPERPEELTARGISSDRLAQELRRVSSQKVLLLVDACYSGSMLAAFRGYEDRRALALLARSAGIHVLAAATRDQRASEIRELGHGVFSYALLRGLGGNAALHDVDRKVTVMSLAAYIRDELPDLGRKYHAEVQDPVSFSNGMDFPLAITR